MLQKFIQELHELHEDWLIDQKHFQVPGPVLVSLSNSHFTHFRCFYIVFLSPHLHPSFRVVFLLLVVLYPVRSPRYCNFLILNCRTFSLTTIILSILRLSIFAVQDIFNMLRYFHISKVSSLATVIL